MGEAGSLQPTVPSQGHAGGVGRWDSNACCASTSCSNGARWPTKRSADALYDSQALRAFAGIDLRTQAVPDATTLFSFRHLLEKRDLTNEMPARGSGAGVGASIYPRAAADITAPPE